LTTGTAVSVTTDGIRALHLGRALLARMPDR